MSVLLRVSGLRYAYPSGVVALRGVDLEVSAGETVAVVGPNGSGKSSLLKAIAGLLKPFEGSIEVEGVDVGRTGVAEVSLRAGLVLQNPDVQLLYGTVAQEIGSGLRNRGMPDSKVAERVTEVASCLGLEHLLDAFPLALPKGERARVVVAAVMATRPRVIMLDEPTTGQDRGGSIGILSMARDYAKDGKAVLFVTHNMELVGRFADRIVLMKDGVIVADGPARSVLSRDRLLREASIIPPQAARIGMALWPMEPCPLDADELAGRVEDELSR